MATPGIIISAPTSGAGKTTVTLGILRALRDKGLNVSAAKIGPDYIDSKFHERALDTRRAIRVSHACQQYTRYSREVVDECMHFVFKTCIIAPVCLAR